MSGRNFTVCFLSGSKEDNMQNRENFENTFSRVLSHNINQPVRVVAHWSDFEIIMKKKLKHNTKFSIYEP